MPPPKRHRSEEFYEGLSDLESNDHVFFHEGSMTPNGHQVKRERLGVQFRAPSDDKERNRVPAPGGHKTPSAKTPPTTDPPPSSSDYQEQFETPIDDRHRTVDVNARFSNQFEGTGISSVGSFHVRNIHINSLYPEYSTPRAYEENPQERTFFSNKLFFAQMDARLLDLEEPQRTTCEWILKKEAYLSSLTSPSGGLLWIKGKPGAGKSVLMKLLYTRASRAAKSKRTTLAICFFFNARGEELARTTVGLYRSLLWQLFDKVKGLEQQVADGLGASIMRAIKENGWEKGTLKHVLNMAIERLDSTTVKLFIDALDECSQDEVREMLDFLDHLADSAGDRRLILHICFSSRHYPQVVMPSDGQLTVRELVLEYQQEHQDDIRKYVEKKLQLRGSHQAQDLRVNILRKSRGVFLWVVLVIRMLNDAWARGRTEELEDLLHEIPSDLTDLFVLILKKDTSDLDFLRRCIQWTLFAKRPLKLDEYFSALRLAAPRPSGDITRDAMRRFVHSSSKGLLEVTRPRNPVDMPSVQVIHEAVRDFFFHKRGHRYLWPQLDDDFATESHATLSKRCMDEINDSGGSILAADTHQSHAEIGIDESDAEAQLDEASLDSVFCLYPLLHYATEHLLYHIDASRAADSRLDLFYHDFGRSRQHWFDLVNSLEEHEECRHTHSGNLTYFCADQGLHRLLERELSRGSSVVVEGGRHRYPLFAAIASGNTGVLKCLFARARQIGNQGDPESTQQLSHLQSLKDRLGLPPLAFAVAAGRSEVVDLLLKNGFRDASFETRDTRATSALGLAADRRDESMVDYLLRLRELQPEFEIRLEAETIACVVAKSDWNIARVLFNPRRIEMANVRIVVGELAGWEYSRYQQDVVGQYFPVWLLAHIGEHVSLQDHLKGEILILAALLGNTAAVERHLDKASDATAKFWPHALSVASKFNHPDVVELLLKHNSFDTSLLEAHIEAALNAASQYGHEDVMKLLMER